MAMPNILESTDQYCEDSGVPVPWMYQQHFVDEWNAVAEKLRFRAYVDKNSRSASRKRLAIIIESNAALLGGSKKTDRDVLTRRFFEQFILACDYLKENGDNDSDCLDILGRQYPKTMSVWVWLRPDLKAIVFLAGLSVGKEDAVAEQEKDKDRRKLKAAALQKLRAHYEEFERKCAYLLPDPDSILMLEPAVTKALAAIEDEVEWLANPPNR